MKKRINLMTAILALGLCTTGFAAVQPINLGYLSAGPNQSAEFLLDKLADKADYTVQCTLATYSALKVGVNTACFFVNGGTEVCSTEPFQIPAGQERTSFMATVNKSIINKLVFHNFDAKEYLSVNCVATHK